MAPQDIAEISFNGLSMAHWFAKVWGRPLLFSGHVSVYDVKSAVLGASDLRVHDNFVPTPLCTF